MRAPDYAPQLATLVKAAPEGEEWLHEIKYDGYRIGCRIRDGRARLYSRNGKDWTAAFPEVVQAAEGLGIRDALLDGEVAVLLPDGRTSFQALQNTFSSSSASARATLVYFVFDVVRLSGQRLTGLPLEERKQRLRAALGPRRKSGRLRYSDHVRGQGTSFFRQACAAGLEGIISKRIDRPYRSGRNDDWLKTKCVLRQEFAIGGFTEPEGARVGIGALLVGHYDDGGRLVFAGKVGTGFTQASSLALRKRLQRIERTDSPFAERPPGALGRTARWVAPQLLCEVEFTEWTSDGKIRHPSFQGLRPDKPATAARKERPDPSIVQGLRITHPSRVVYPELGITKVDVARYYEAIGQWIVPHVKSRPLTLVRCPDGVGGECFFMKHSQVWAPAPLRRVRIQEQKKLGEYLIADDLAGVVGLVQMGVLEIHTWNSNFDRVEQPNRLVFDLDPGAYVTWERVVEAARMMRDSLKALGLDSFVKTTGGVGLHVVAPLVPHADWATCLAFARALAGAVQTGDPVRFTTNFAKAGRADKILIDYLRNNRTNTSIAAYSARAQPRATVSVPIAWKELSTSLDPASFTVATVPARLAKLRSDPWDGYHAVGRKLTRQMLQAVGL